MRCWIQNTLIHRTLLYQLLLELRVRDDAFLNQQLGECVSHCEGRDHEFLECYRFAVYCAIASPI